MRLLEKSLLLVANRMMKDVGRLRELHLNTKEKSASTVMMLVGETRPIDVTVGRYELLRKEDGKVVLQLRDVSCSREWMDQLAGRLEPQMNIDLPPAIASVLRLARMV